MTDRTELDKWQGFLAEHFARGGTVAMQIGRKGPYWVLVEPDGDRETASTGCTCTPHDQYAGGGYWEHLLEYEPDCPEHSIHVWNPRALLWEYAPGIALPSDRDALADLLMRWEDIHPEKASLMADAIFTAGYRRQTPAPEARTSTEGENT